jgi:hypothetical protein
VSAHGVAPENVEQGKPSASGDNQPENTQTRLSISGLCRIVQNMAFGKVRCEAQSRHDRARVSAQNASREIKRAICLRDALPPVFRFAHETHALMRDVNPVDELMPL